MNIVKDKQSDLYFREGTLDKWIFEHIGEYRISKFLKQDDIVIDIGAHAGYFSALAIDSGAKKVYAFEIYPDNIKLCELNLNKYNSNRYEICSKAVWRSDRIESVKMPAEFPVWYEALNTGGNGIVFEGDIEIDTVSLDEIVLKVRQEFPDSRILLKIDAESSEWSILLTSKRLSEIDTIIGEYHELGGLYDNHNPEILDLGYKFYTIYLLESFLKNLGYVVLHNRYTDLNIGHFYARKRE